MNIENVQEAIESVVDAVTVDIPVRIKMTSINGAPFEFTPSIDEVGQIVLTPTSKDVEFVDANTDANVDLDTPVIEQETVTTNDGALTTKETSIIIKASMLAEDENCYFSAVVDEIGQVIIYPTAEKNVFLTASFEDSLNLVTEDLQTVDYFGYKLINNGDGWDVYDSTDELIDEGVATLAEAKILVCTTEIHRLEELTESVEVNEKLAEETIDTEDNDAVPDVDAEVITEAVVDAEAEPEEFDKHAVRVAIEDITSNYTELEGAVKCDTDREKDECERLLNEHYATVDTSKEDNSWTITYKEPFTDDVHTTEE